MLTEYTGNLFDSTADAIGHGVNCYGVMGAGIAKEFRRLLPDMYTQYKLFCDANLLYPSFVFPWQSRKKLILNIASQNAPGANAMMWALVDGVIRAIEITADTGRTSLALPRIGCGIGGLAWDHVKGELEYLDGHRGVSLEIWTLE